MSKTATELPARLDYYYYQVKSIILSRQHPITGLLPASTAANAHGDYTDAWVRDNVYCRRLLSKIADPFMKNHRHTLVTSFEGSAIFEERISNESALMKAWNYVHRRRRLFSITDRQTRLYEWI